MPVKAAKKVDLEGMYKRAVEIAQNEIDDVKDVYYNPNSNPAATTSQYTIILVRQNQYIIALLEQLVKNSDDV